MVRDAQQAAGTATMSDGMRLLVFGIMALGMFMSLLDIQIVAASLPEVTAGLAAGIDEGTWIQTAYLIAEIVMIPLSGFLSRAFSTRWVFTASAAAFTLSSIACGFAWNLQSAILFRAIQGFVGGAMIPTVFATGYALFQGPKQALIPAILGLTGTVAPILGPVLGGWITDVLSWRWLFFINVPPGLLITILVPIYGRIDEPDLSILKGFDIWSVPLLAMFLGGLEYVLEQGPRWDWFEDSDNLIVAVLSALAAAGFFWRSLSHPRPVVDLRVFSNARFAAGCLFQFVLGIGLFGAIYLVPQFLAQVQHYKSIDIGKAVFITGAAQIVSTPLSAVLSRRLDPRHMLIFGFLAFAASSYWNGHVSSAWGGHELFLPQALRGFSIMFCIVPATNLCLGAMPPQLLKAASGLSNLMRSLGGAVGIAGANTVINNRYHLHFDRIVERLDPSNPALSPALQDLRGIAGGAHMDPGLQQHAALQYLLQTVNREALALSFADNFLLLSVLFVAVLTVIPFVAPAPPPKAAPAVDH
jgi:DHA2 family multidrug resistance protein